MKKYDDEIDYYDSLFLVDLPKEVEDINNYLQSVDSETDYDSLGEVIASIAGAEDEFAPLYGITSMYLYHHVCKKDRNLLGIYRMLETCNPYTDKEVDVIDVLYRDKRLIQSARSRYDDIRHSYSDFHKACSDAKNALAKYVDFDIYETRMYPLI